VLAAGEVVDARAGRERRVVFAIDGGVDQGRRAAVVLVRGVGVEDFGREPGRRAREDAAGEARFGVFLGQVCEREDIGGIEGVQEGVAVARGLGEADIEAPASRACDMRDDAVENLAVLLVAR
jgi:hypothetical protein